ncbi:MAG: TrbC/VirB2 family protein [Trueperaceae bacterium]
MNHFVGMLKKWGLVSVILMTIFSSSLVFAEANDRDVDGAGGDETFGTVQEAVCNVATSLQGPVGIAVGFLVLVGGIIAMQVANRDAIPMISRAVIGTALLMGAGAAFAAIVTGTGCGGGGGA